ncbi:unnamed protein product, partial [Medioppia subpectinata]
YINGYILCQNLYLGLQYLSLRELLLEPNEAQYLLDDVAINCCQTLTTLKVINCSKRPYPILHVGVFINLKLLVISPQHLSEDVVELLSETKLRDLWIVQNKYTEQCWPVSGKTWRECRNRSPMLRIHLVVTGRVDTQVLLCQMCVNLKTLIIRELISTATLLVIVTTAESLTRFVVRKNAIIKRFDWKRQTQWSDGYYLWLKTNSRSYEKTFEEISKIFGKKWLPLTDEEFKHISPDTTF